MTTEDQLIESIPQIEELKDKKEEKDEVETALEADLGIDISKLLGDSYVMSEHEEITKLSDSLRINATDARKQLNVFPPNYTIQDQTIPDLIRKMRRSRRKLKGSQRDKMTKAIDTMIDAYSDHLSKCIDTIYWLNPYKIPLNKMRYNEKTYIS